MTLHRSKARSTKGTGAAALALGVLLASPAGGAGPPAAGQSAALATRALAILEEHCSECHDDLARSGLNVLERGALLGGGDRGRAVRLGQGRESLLVQVMRHQVKPSMPPGAARIPDEDIAAIEAWIDAGLPWPAGRQPADDDENRGPRWWSFKAPARPKVPTIAGAAAAWVRTPIDAFLLEKMHAAKLTPAAEADRRTLIRRASFDLLGLPPSPDEIRAFEQDQAPDAYERLIEKLLASSHYGEKWGRYWLDLARYGDSSGFEQDPYLLDAWRYRDYVIESFNEDKPYDRFVKEQIAADELWPDDVRARRGTGFYTVGPNRDMLFKVEDTNRVEMLTDFVDTTSALFLGLSVGCARCHDHKFDPITQKDYYKLQAIFAPAVKHRIFLDYNGARAWDIDENYRQFKLRDLGAALTRLFEPYRKRIHAEKKARLPLAARQALDTPEAQRTAEQQGLVAQYKKSIEVKNDEIRALLVRNSGDLRRLEAFETDLVDMYSNFGSPPMAPGLMDAGRIHEVTYMPTRNGGGAGTPIKPGFPDALGGGTVPDAPAGATTTGRRRALAEWLVRPDHPLTARVMVNRIWHGHFARGLVATPSDFGRKGMAPSHPELLDWLATEFVAQGWSMKAVHRLVMTSSAYRQSAVPGEAALERDPENLLLSHQRRRRLTAEEIRDAVLSSAGALSLEMGGPPVVPPLPAEELFGLSVPIKHAWPVSRDTPDHNRRSVYLIRKRGFQQPLFEVFDSPDGALHCPRRDASTMAPQSLSLLNSDFVVDMAQRFAARALRGTKSAPTAVVVERAFQLALGRAPSRAEDAMAAAFLAEQQRRVGTRARAVAELGRALFNINEFLYVD